MNPTPPQDNNNSVKLTKTDFHVSPSQVIEVIRVEAERMLRQVGLIKLKEEKMVSPSFNFLFDVLSSEGSARVAVAKLANVLAKYLLKLIPFNAYLVGATSNKHKISIPVSVSSVRQGKVIKRYIRAINYKSRLHGVPGVLTLDESENSEYERMEEARVLVEGTGAKPRTPSLRNVNFVWTSSYLSNPSGVANFDEERLSQFIKHEGPWTHMSYAAFGRRARERSPMMEGLYSSIRGNLLTPERIFFFLPQIIKVLTTVSRKGVYDYRAFSIATE